MTTGALTQLASAAESPLPWPERGEEPPIDGTDAQALLEQRDAPVSELTRWRQGAVID
jgi:hypothetical protein